MANRVDDVKSADGVRLALHRWDPSGPVRGDALLVHGYADHMGRYGHVGDALAAAGWRVTGVDLRGHGESDGRRGHVHDWSEYMADMRAASAAVGGPHVIVAHSMGALVTLDHLRDVEAAANVRGAVLSGPLLRPTVEAPRWKRAAARFLSRAIPTLALANEIPAAHVSRHPEIVRAYDSDPLVFSTVTPRWFTEMTKAAERVVAHAPRYAVPALIMWGESDKIVALDAIAGLCDAYGAPLERRAWSGLYHEIFNEPERDEVLRHAVEWLDAHAAVASA